MHATEILADHVSSVRAADLSDAARRAACRCVLDLLAAAIPGGALPSIAATRKAAHALYGRGDSAIWFSAERLTPAGAVFCNSAAAAPLDLDDGHRLARGHPGAAVIPTALAVAAEVGASADEVLTAIALGYEVGVRIAAARGYYGRSGTWCAYAAAATAGRLRRTPVPQLAHALAIAGMTGPNLLAPVGAPRAAAPVANDVKEGIPFAAAGGMAALACAEAGLTGPLELLDDIPGFDPETLRRIVRPTTAVTEAYFKPYACCRHLHAPIDALLGTLRHHRIAPETVGRVDVHIYSGALTLPNRAEADSLVEVQFSIPYSLGLAAHDGTAAFLPLDESALGRPEIVAFARKVALHLDPALDARFPRETLARVDIATDSGTFSSEAVAPRGEASAPLSDAELAEKFLLASRKVFDRGRQELLLAAVERLVQGEIAPLLTVLATA